MLSPPPILSANKCLSLRRSRGWLRACDRSSFVGKDICSGLIGNRPRFFKCIVGIGQPAVYRSTTYLYTLYSVPKGRITNNPRDIESYHSCRTLEGLTSHTTRDSEEDPTVMLRSRRLRAQPERIRKCSGSKLSALL